MNTDDDNKIHEIAKKISEGRRDANGDIRLKPDGRIEHDAYTEHVKEKKREIEKQL